MDEILLFKAIEFASRAHEGQRRKGKNPPPYILHPYFVGMELLNLGYKQEVVIAGFLHDTIEDGFSSFKREEVKKMIREKFGERVLELVEAQTEPKDPSMTKEEKIKTWECRNQTKLEKLKRASPLVRAISTIDLLSNIIELQNLLENEGKNASQYFNIDIQKKFFYIEKQLEIYEKDKNFPHSKLIPLIRKIICQIKNIGGFE